MALQTIVGHLTLFSVSWSYTQSVGLLGRASNGTQDLYQHSGQHKQNTRTQTCTPLAGFEPETWVFVRKKTALALDRVATVIGVFVK
jgi:hypothetical protein